LDNLFKKTNHVSVFTFFMAPLGSAAFEAEFRRKYAELCATGMAANLAAANAIRHAGAFEELATPAAAPSSSAVKESATLAAAPSSSAAPMEDDVGAKKHKAEDRMAQEVRPVLNSMEDGPATSAEAPASGSPVPRLVFKAQLSTARSAAVFTGDWAALERLVGEGFSDASVFGSRHMLPPSGGSVFGLGALDAVALSATYAELDQCAGARGTVFDAFIAAVHDAVARLEDELRQTCVPVRDDSLLGFLALLHNPVLTERVTPETQVKANHIFLTQLAKLECA